MAHLDKGGSSPSSVSVFFLLLASHLLAAAYSPIQDCDEVFNFWEPTHYLNHGFGLQTWELSPEYAIRSWLYTSLHAIPISIISLFVPAKAKYLEFYVMRGLLAAVCAACETRLYGAISQSISARVAAIYLLVSASSAGIFHASVSYLPSTFAMYTSMLATAYMLESRTQDRLAQGLTCFAIGTIVGWPFVAVLAVPFVLWHVYRAVGYRQIDDLAQRLLKALGNSLLVLGLENLVDSAFYRKIVCVPFNIVWYNVFSAGKGPNIYGVEPWHFYIRNLLINFNVWLILALLTVPLLGLQYALAGPRRPVIDTLTAAVTTTPFYLWLAIFTAQPHKEERFMYPIYPFIALNAAISLHLIIHALSASSEKSFSRRIPQSIRFLAVISMLVVPTALGVLRTAGLATAYSAPLGVYESLFQDVLNSLNSSAPTVCVGQEWYRFPSSYHLPAEARLKFFKSDFDGLLPGEFLESGNRLTELFPGARVIPEGMNDENKEDPGKYVDLDSCTYLVDYIEPESDVDEETWRRRTCLPFLDAASTGTIARLFWIPDIDLITIKYRRNWGQYCLFERS